MHRGIIVLVILLAPSATFAQAPGEAISALELAQLFRSLVVPHLPEPLIETKSNWGKQREVTTSWKWEKRPGDRRAQFHPVKEWRNDGRWRKLTVTMHDPSKSFRLAIREIYSPEEGIVRFEMWIAFGANLRFEQQNWESGLRLYGGSTRAHCTVVMRLGCEITTRFEKGTSKIPDAVFRMRILNANLAYTDFEVDHILGIGGDGAKHLGDAILDFVREVKPGLEAELIAKGNAAIVKAGDSKEIRVSLEKLLKGDLPKLPIPVKK